MVYYLWNHLSLGYSLIEFFSRIILMPHTHKKQFFRNVMIEIESNKYCKLRLVTSICTFTQMHGQYCIICPNICFFISSAMFTVWLPKKFVDKRMPFSCCFVSQLFQLLSFNYGRKNQDLRLLSLIVKWKTLKEAFM